MVTSLKSTGSHLVLLSSVMETSAMPTRARALVPAKITSSLRLMRRGARRLLAQHPAHGVGDVALAGAVGSDDGGDAGIEDELGLAGEGLEALKL